MVAVDFEPYHREGGEWVWGWANYRDMPFEESVLPRTGRGGLVSHYKNKNWVGYCLGKSTPWGDTDVEGNGSLYTSTTHGDNENAYLIGGYHTGGPCPIQFEHRSPDPNAEDAPPLTEQYRLKNIHVKDLLIGIDNEFGFVSHAHTHCNPCLLYTSPSPRDRTRSRMPSSA